MIDTAGTEARRSPEFNRRRCPIPHEAEEDLAMHLGCFAQLRIDGDGFG